MASVPIIRRRRLNAAAHCILGPESAKKTHCSQALGRTYFTHVEKRQSKIDFSALVSCSQQVPLGGQRSVVGLPGLVLCCCTRSCPLLKGTDKAVGLATCHMMCLSRTKEHRERSFHTRWQIQQGCEDSSLGEEVPRPKVYTYLAQWGQKPASRGLLFPTEWCIHPILICYIILEENSLSFQENSYFSRSSNSGKILNSGKICNSTDF